MRNPSVDLLQELQAALTIRDGLQQQLQGRESEIAEVCDRTSQILGELQAREDELAQLRADFESQVDVAATVRVGLEQQLRKHLSKSGEIRTRWGQSVEKLQARGRN
jgi:chromosome segregation ATPase